MCKCTLLAVKQAFEIYSSHDRKAFDVSNIQKFIYYSVRGKSESEFGFIHQEGLHKHGIYCGRKVQTINIYGSSIKKYKTTVV